MDKNQEKLEDDVKDLNDENEHKENDTGVKQLLIDIIIDKAGYCCEVWKVIFLVSFMLSNEGIFFLPFTIIFVPFQTHFNISSMTVSLISALMFITIGIGSLSAGFLTSKFKRTHLILSAVVGVFICSILMGAIDNVYSYTTIRCICGFFLGVAVPIVMCILVEYLHVSLCESIFNELFICNYTVFN